jgi:lipopolysaccharide biosynthesis glycosyltransferase
MARRPRPGGDGSMTPGPIAGAPPATIVFATDNAYCQHLAVALVTLFEHNQHLAFDIRIVCVAVAEANKQRLLAVCQAHGRSARFLDFDPTPYVGFRVDGHITWASYARIFLPALIEPEIGRVLYLDSDIVVLDAIDPLLDTDIGDHPIAGIPQPFTDRREELGIPADKPYVNAGVLILNLDVWRREAMTGRLVEFIEANAPRLKFHDQDTLNAFFHDRVLALPFRWNLHHHVFAATAQRLGCSDAERRRIFAEPGIVHFTTASKPWHFVNDHAFKRAYLRALRKTPYRDYRYPDLTPWNVGWKLGRRLKWALMRLGGRPRNLRYM